MKNIVDSNGPEDEVKSRLNEIWRTGDLKTFFGDIHEHLADKEHRRLYKKFHGRLSLEDCVYCFDDAIEGLLSRISGNPEPIEDAVAYIRRAAYIAAVSMIKERGDEAAGREALLRHLRPHRGRRKRVLRPDCKPGESEYTEIPEQAAVIMVEELLDMEADPAVVARAVRVAVSRLSPPLRKAATQVMTHGAGYSASDALSDIGMSPDAFRQNKRRAFQKLPGMIRTALEELHADTRNIRLPELQVGPPERVPTNGDDEAEQ